MRYENKDYVTSLYIKFEPVQTTILKELKEMVDEFLWWKGLDLEHYEIGYLIDNKTKDMFEGMTAYSD